MFHEWPSNHDRVFMYRKFVIRVVDCIETAIKVRHGILNGEEKGAGSMEQILLADTPHQSPPFVDGEKGMEIHLNRDPTQH